jgi:hypothetical protein
MRFFSEKSTKSDRNRTTEKSVALFMAQEQLELVDIYTFGNLTKAPGEDTWNVLIIAKNAQ